jgi:hypothetical protein
MFQHIAAYNKIAYAIRGPSCFFSCLYKANMVKQYLTEKPDLPTLKQTLLISKVFKHKNKNRLFY